MSKKKSTTIVQPGERKRAIARAALKPGTGRVKIDNLLLDHYGSGFVRARIMEPMLLAGDVGKKVDIHIRVKGSGVNIQADAIRLAIARALAVFDSKLKSVFLEYDRQLLVADVRRKEPSTPNSHGQARAKRQKSYR